MSKKITIILSLESLRELVEAPRPVFLKDPLTPYMKGPQPAPRTVGYSEELEAIQTDIDRLSIEKAELEAAIALMRPVDEANRVIDSAGTQVLDLARMFVGPSGPNWFRGLLSSMKGVISTLGVETDEDLDVWFERLGEEALTTIPREDAAIDAAAVPPRDSGQRCVIGHRDCTEHGELYPADREDAALEMALEEQKGRNRDTAQALAHDRAERLGLENLRPASQPTEPDPAIADPATCAHPLRDRVARRHGSHCTLCETTIVGESMDAARAAAGEPEIPF